MSYAYNILAPEVLADPYPLYAELRSKAPVCQVGSYGYWAVSRYDDVVYVLKHPELFPSSGIFEARQRTVDERLRDGMILGQVNLIGVDPPVHTQQRKLISGAFTPKAIARLEERVRAITTEYIDKLLTKDTFDMMADLAVPLPITVIAEMLGVDPALRADFKRWSDDAINLPIGNRQVSDEEVERILRSRREMRAYFREIIQERKRRPGEDLISDLIRGEVEYGLLTEDDVLGTVVLLLIAGNETTTNLIGNGTFTLLQHPDALRRLREEPALIPNFIEEVLRYNGPVRMLTRRAAEDVTLSGVTIRRAPWCTRSSPPRTATRRSSPTRIGSTSPGSRAARGLRLRHPLLRGRTALPARGRIAFEELLRRLPSFSRKPGEIDWYKSMELHGLKTLALRFDRAAVAA